MKFWVLPLLLLTCFCLTETLQAQPFRLKVAGDAKIFGRLDIRASAVDSTSLFIGRNAGLNDDGDNFNTALGTDALRANTSGILNTALGAFALSDNTTGTNNIAIGHLALGDNTEGESNTAVGFFSLGTSTTGSENTAVGLSALSQIKTGSKNTGVGRSALGGVSDGTSNTAIGYNALAFGSGNTASRNTAIGNESLFSTSSDGNTAVGYRSLFKNTSGSGNTAHGTGALINNTTGEGNTAVGEATMQTNTTGILNTALGFGSGVSSAALSNATAVGAYAIVSRANSLVLGSNANVGIGTSSPLSKLHIEGGDDVALNFPNTSTNNGQLMLGSSTGSNIAMDQNEIMARNNGAVATLNLNLAGGIVRIAGASTTSEQGKLEVIHGNGFSSNGVFITRGGATPFNPTESWNLYTSAAGNLVFIQDGNDVKVLEEDGDFVDASDRRLKRNIKYLDKQLRNILKLNPATYQYINQKDDEQQYGFIAQEVQKLYPDLVSTIKRESGEDYLGISYQEFIPLLVVGIQEQQAVIEAKDQQIQDLETRLQKVEALLFGNTSDENESLHTRLTDVARLYPNQPNPFAEKTLIRYQIPEGSTTASIRITNLEGKIIKTIPIQAGGEGQLTVHADTLSSGIYFYSLIVNGELIGTEKMVLTGKN